MYRFVLVFLLASILGGNTLLPASIKVAAQSRDTVSRSERLDTFREYLRFGEYLSGGDVTPEWMSDGDRFWYERSDDGELQYKLVDPAAGTTSDLFDETRLRQQLEKLLGEPLATTGLPFDEFTFSASGGVDLVTFEVDSVLYKLDLATYEIGEAPPAEDEPRPRRIPEFAGVPSYFSEVPSPDGRWFAGIDQGNIVLRVAGTDSLVRLTTDGSDDRPWGSSMWELGLYWSPDSRVLLAGWLQNPIGERWPLVHYPSLDQMDQEEVPPTVEWRPGSWYNVEPQSYELYLFDVESGRRTSVDFENPRGQSLSGVEWTPDGTGILVMRQTFRGKAMELLVVDPEDGSHRILLSDTLERGNVYAPNEWMDWHFLRDGRRFILRSVRDGWHHLSLYDIEDGLTRRLTRGPYPVRTSVVDEENGWVYFAAHNIDSDRPYDRHVGRVPLEGGEMEILTEEPGQHWYSLSPSRHYFVDTHTSLDRPLQSDLRAADGSLITTLERGSADRARDELHWTPPAEFVATASDGTTRLFGTLFKPWDFDPERQYPVIDFVHAMHGLGAASLRTDLIGSLMHIPQALAQLGFIVVTFDDRGTYWRGRDFRLSTWGRGETDQPADHRAVLQQLAASRPWMDLGRVGTVGHSTFGFRAVRLMLLEPDLYDVGVSSAGPDLRRGAEDSYWSEISGSEETPFRPNSALAENLKGRLLLIAGTEDFQGSLVSMIPLIQGLVQAQKRYELCLIPGAGHGMFFPGRPYSDYHWDTVANYLLDHLVD